jgi:seryl-tRNA synthetase
VEKLLDLRFVRENIPAVRRAIEIKGEQAALDDFLRLDTKRRELLQEVEELKHQRNVVSKDVGRLKKEGRDAAELVEKMRLVNERIKELDEEQRQIDTTMEEILLHIPNLPDPDVPVGTPKRTTRKFAAGGTSRNLTLAPSLTGSWGNSWGYWISPEPGK